MLLIPNASTAKIGEDIILLHSTDTKNDNGVYDFLISLLIMKESCTEKSTKGILSLRIRVLVEMLMLQLL